MKQNMGLLKSDKLKRFKMMTKKQISQLSMEEESESTKPVCIIFMFYKLFKFLVMLYNNVWLQLGLLLNIFKNFRPIEVCSK